MKTMTFTEKQIKQRAIKRVAEVIYGQWEEESGTHSRIFEVLVSDYLVADGESVKGNNYREHAVPCVLIRDQARDMYENGFSVKEVCRMIEKHLRIVYISKEEAKYLDTIMGLKEKMPEDWEFGKSDPLARITEAGIELV